MRVGGWACMYTVCLCSPVKIVALVWDTRGGVGGEGEVRRSEGFFCYKPDLKAFFVTNLT